MAPLLVRLGLQRRLGRRTASRSLSGESSPPATLSHRPELQDSAVRHFRAPAALGSPRQCCGRNHPPGVTCSLFPLRALGWFCGHRDLGGGGGCGGTQFLSPDCGKNQPGWLQATELNLCPPRMFPQEATRLCPRTLSPLRITVRGHPDAALPVCTCLRLGKQRHSAPDRRALNKLSPRYLLFPKSNPPCKSEDCIHCAHSKRR